MLDSPSLRANSVRFAGATASAAVGRLLTAPTLGRALAGFPRDSYCLVGAVGHDFYKGQRQTENQ